MKDPPKSKARVHSYNSRQNEILPGEHSLSKELLYSFAFLLAVGGRGERVCAVAVGGPLW